MSALDELMKKSEQGGVLSPIEDLIRFAVQDGYIKLLIEAAAELARLRAIEAAARELVAELRENWNNIENLVDDRLYRDTDLTGRVMKQLAAALERK